MTSKKSTAKLMLIGEVSERTGLSRQVLHRYIDMGLIDETDRNESGYRLFDESVVERLELIKDLNSTDYTLRQIKEIFLK